MAKKESYIGVDMGGTKILAVLVNAAGKVLHSYKELTRQDGTPLADQVAATIDGVLAKASIDAKGIGGIGVAVPGVVDSQTGLFVVAPNLDIDDPDLVGALRKRYPVPVVIGNDVNFGTYAEAVLGAGRGAASSVGVFVGTGIGGGVVIDGVLRTGPEDLAGEIGHMVVMVDGPTCGCGAKGCWEALASRTAIERDIRQALADGKTSVISQLADLNSSEESSADHIRSGALRKALKQGDPLITEVMTRVAHYLAAGVLTIRHLLDPDVIIFGGGVIEACGDFLMPLIEAEVRADTMTGSHDSMRLVVSQLEDDAVALGAAIFARGGVEDASACKTPAPEEAPKAEGESGYPTLGQASFGTIVVDKREVANDIFIHPDGRLAKRRKKPVRAKYGTSHVVDREELEKLFGGKPCALVIGAGHSSMVRLAEDAQAWLAELGVEWQLLPTPEAAEAFNKLPGPKALLLHVTC
jgi:glucokinase